MNSTLSAANQNGSDPGLITDPLGVVPTTAFGSAQFLLDTTANTLDFQISVDGILRSELRDFGPNGTPIHLHLANAGSSGNFGPIAIDLALGAIAGDFVDTATGFTFSRTGVSILLADQGGVTLGMHPGDALIVDSLLSGNAFVLVHSTKNIFTSTGGPAPGFPFGEIRGNLTANVPTPSSALALGLGIGLLAMQKRRQA